MNSTTKNIILLFVIVIIAVIFMCSASGTGSNQVQVPNSEIKDGVQYITINAKGGYSPKSSLAKSGIPTKLIVKTDNTFDCSASLAIRSIRYQKILPQNGKETIDIGTPKAGDELRGVCSMGMYSFVVNFK